MQLPKRAKMDDDVVRNVIILACAVDAADKALLPATFKAMAVQMQIGPTGLGVLTFAQTMGFALALPLWGSLMRTYSTRDLLAAGCAVWGLLTVFLAIVTDYHYQIVLRFLVGGALASVNPLGQALLCDLVPEGDRGKVFGLNQSVSTALTLVVSFVATSIALTTHFGVLGWRLAYLGVAFASLLTAWLVFMVVPAGLAEAGKDEASQQEANISWFARQRQVLQVVFKKPSFVIMVLQGVTGGIPWNAFAFLIFYFQLSGYTDLEAGQVMLWGGFGGVLGGLLGGYLGDGVEKLKPLAGRTMVAQTSVALGTVAFVWLVSIPYGAGSFFLVALAMFVFNAVAGWTQPAALRPMCGELFDSPEERAQVLSLMIALETVSSAFFGAPLCGWLSEQFGYNLVAGRTGQFTGDTSTSLTALRNALLGVSIPPWVMCMLFWVPMYWTFPRDRVSAKPDADERQPLVNKSA